MGSGTAPGVVLPNQFPSMGNGAAIWRRTFQICDVHRVYQSRTGEGWGQSCKVGLQRSGPGGLEWGVESGLLKFYCTSNRRSLREGDRGGVPVLEFSVGPRRVSSGGEQRLGAAICSSQEIAYQIHTTGPQF